jgi:hypothetical protein
MMNCINNANNVETRLIASLQSTVGNTRNPHRTIGGTFGISEIVTELSTEFSGISEITTEPSTGLSEIPKSPPNSQRDFREFPTPSPNTRRNFREFTITIIRPYRRNEWHLYQKNTRKSPPVSGKNYIREEIYLHTGGNKFIYGRKFTRIHTQQQAGATTTRGHAPLSKTDN